MNKLVKPEIVGQQMIDDLCTEIADFEAKNPECMKFRTKKRAPRSKLSRIYQVFKMRIS